MSAIYDEFERELGRLRARFSSEPRAELTRLFYLALEREEIVSVAYRERAIAERLSRMPIGAEVRELIRHALVWAWKDEEMHAIYVRGAILRTGNLASRGMAFGRQMAGAVGGWAASVRQHARWRDAPLSRLGATLITIAGSWTGKVPPAVRRALEYGPFRDFCAYNIDAERTAARCWTRIVELASRDAAFPPSLIADFERIAADEVKHERIFEILHRTLNDGDALAAGHDAGTLSAEIAAVGESFLPRSMRKTSNPLGAGGVVHVECGTPGDDKRAVLRRLLDRAGLKEKIGRLKSGATVAIKPSFMLGYDRRDLSNVTDPELVDELAHLLREWGAGDVAVVEAANIYDHFYANRSVASVARYMGYDSGAHRIVDATEEQVPHAYHRGLAQRTISKTWRDAAFRISFAKMRSHPIELAYLSVANCEWLGGRCDEYLFFERQAQRQTAIMMLLDEFPPHFALIDAYDSAADGIIGVMGCPRPPAPRRLYAGDDALAVDLVAARHIQMRETREDSILRAATHWFGEPSRDVVVDGRDEAITPWRGPYDNEVWALMSVLAYPVYVVGSGRGTVWVPEMDEMQFPPIGGESRMLKIVRGAARRLVGLHHTRPSP